jgi:hypothetical protein
MSPRPRIGSASVASAAAIGLTVAIGVVPPAAAEPCTGAAAAAQPPAAPNARATPALPGLNGPPIGHKPRNATDGAPLPKLGQLPRAVLNALTPNAGRVQQQAGVTPPAPNPPPQGPDAAVIAQPAPAPPPAPAPGPPPGTSLVGWVTGPDSPNNTIQRFAITGTDLGIMWDNGDPANSQVLMAFGDTNGYCSVPGKQWRYNVLFRTQDRALSNTISVPNGVLANRYSGSPVWAPGISKQIINSIKFAPSETGIIPTAGISVGTNQYINFMSIKNWDSPGSWTTNFSAIAMSPDNGENWGVYPGTVRTARPGDAKVPYVPGNENFQQTALLRSGDGYVYTFGTPSGRGGPAFVARVPQGSVPDLTKYEYWNGGSWVPNNPSAATPVIPGPVGEMSVQYNTYLKRFLTLYGNPAGDVVSRTAGAPQGPWEGEQVLVPSNQFPGGIYAPFLHPWSTGKELYFNLSLWSAYNVMLMKTVLP